MRTTLVSTLAPTLKGPLRVDAMTGTDLMVLLNVQVCLYVCFSRAPTHDIVVASARTNQAYFLVHH